MDNRLSSITGKFKNCLKGGTVHKMIAFKNIMRAAMFY